MSEEEYYLSLAENYAEEKRSISCEELAESEKDWCYDNL